MMDNRILLAASAILLALGACSSGPEEAADDAATTPDADVSSEVEAPAADEATEAQEVVAETEAAEEAPAPEPTATPTPTPTVTAAAAPATAVAKVAAAGPPTIYMQRCAVCHSAEKGGENKLGPNLYGTFGKPMGEGSFSFSTAVKESGLVMDEATLHAWLENPRKLIPGNRMIFPGLRDAAQRQEIIDYLKAQS